MRQKVKNIVTNKYSIIFTVALLLYTLFGFVGLPFGIRWYLPKFVEENLHSKASIESVRFNPFLFTLDLRKFRLEDTDENLLMAFDRFHMDLDPGTSLIRLALVLRTIELDQPDIRLVLDKNGVSNFERLLPPADPEESDSAESSALFPFILVSARIQEGLLTVIDQRQSTPAQLALHGITLDVQELSSLQEKEGVYKWAVAVKDAGALEGDGTISLTPFRTDGNAGIKDVPLATLWQFLRDSTNLEEPSGRLDFFTRYTVAMTSDTDEILLTETELSLTEIGLRLHKEKKDLLTLQTCKINAPTIDLTTQNIQIAQILLENGAVDARIHESGVVNFEQIIREAATQPPPSSPSVIPAQAPITAGAAENQPADSSPSPPADTPLVVDIEAVDIKNIALEMEDLSRKSPLHAEIKELNLHLQADIENDAVKTAVIVQKIGTELKDIRLGTVPSEPPLFAANQIIAENGHFDLSGQSITIDRVVVAKGRLDAGLDPQGSLNWQEMLEPKSAASAASPTQSAPPQKESVWKFLVRIFEIKEFSSQFTDQTTGSKKPVLSLKNINIRGTDIDGQSPMGVSMAAQIEQGGSLSVKGKINPSIPSVDAEIQADSLNLVSLQPYLTQQAHLLLSSAAISTKGRLHHGVPGKKYETAYEGSFSFNDLLLTYADNPKKPYLGWKAVQIPQFRLTLEPNRFEAREIVIVKPMTEMIIEKDATLNLTKVIKEAPPAKTDSKTKKTKGKATAKQQEEDFPFQISKIRIEQGNMVFADLSLIPQFMTRIHELKGTVTGLSSAKNAQAAVQINGMVDRFGTAHISGQINTSDVPRDSKIAVDFRNVEMKNLSPYSGRFAGRLIKSGKVSANLKYTFHENKMVGDNKIIIDKLALGDRVDNPDSANLPLDLAIAILQDSNGRIDIGLPVSGNLDDPEFSFGAIVWKAFSGLITKLATSPFRMLGGLFGDDDDNDAVLFAQGRTDILPPEKEKLLKLAEVLQARPQLKLVLQGQYNARTDGGELQQDAVRTEVFRKLGFKPESDTLTDPLNFSDGSTQDALEELYKERFGKKALEELEQNIAAGTVTPRMPTTPEPVQLREPSFFCKIIESIQLRNILPGGMSQEEATLWSGELYTQLSENEKVTEESLLRLADKRAHAVAELLSGEGRIAADRVQVLTAEPLQSDEPPSVVLSLDTM